MLAVGQAAGGREAVHSQPRHSPTVGRRGLQWLTTPRTMTS